MGLLSILRNMKKDESEARILMLGLDNGGKTTILRSLSNEDVSTVMPTQGFNIKSLQHENIKLNVWDIGGQKSIRPYWSNYFEASDALVYVVDSSDSRRLDESSAELRELLAEEKLANVPVLIYANKQDIEGCCDVNAVLEGLNIGDVLETRTWTCQACSAVTQDGLQDGLVWLIEAYQARAAA